MADMMTNEPGPADGDRKIEAGVQQSFDNMYKEILAKEESEKEQKTRDEAIAEFQKIHKHGFVTQSDVDGLIKNRIEASYKDVSDLRKEWQEFKVWAMKDKAQGRNTGKTDETLDEPSAMKSWERAWRR